MPISPILTGVPCRSRSTMRSYSMQARVVAPPRRQQAGHLVTRRPFGVLGEVSAFTLGGAGADGRLGDTSPTWTRRPPTIRAAVDAGVDHIDVAPAYGDGEAERAVGAAFGGRLPAGGRISTKVPLDRPSPGALRPA